MKDNSIKIFSILLAISWLTVLFFVVYPFLKLDTMPNFWLLLILAVLPLLMLAQKLKIGSFFDFSKSDSPPHQTTTIAQQINLSVMGEDSANALVNSISKTLELQRGQLPSSYQKKYSKYNRLNHSIDLILITSLSTIRAFYSFVTVMVHDNPSTIPDDALNESIGIEQTFALFPEKGIDYSPILPLIDVILTNIKSVFSTSTTEILPLHFRNIRKLIELRTSTPSKTGKLEFTTEISGLIVEAFKSEIYLSGFLTGNWSMLRLSMKTLLSTNKPINKSSDNKSC